MKITWKNEKRKTADLLPADYNPRMLTDRERSDLEESITKFGSAEPIVINTGSRANILIGGHQRVKIYSDLGIEEIDVRVPSRELTIEEETELNLRLNKNTGSWDLDKLKDLDIEKLLEVGFGDEELSDLWDDVGTFDDNYNVTRKIKEIKTTTVSPGEIYQLGKHRLMCGDATNLNDVKALMGESEKANMVYCDPPYNIGLDYDKGVNLHHKPQQYGGEQSGSKDKKSKKEYGAFLEQAIVNALEVAHGDAHVFYWCDQNYIWLIQQLFLKYKLGLRRVCLWIKNGMNLKPQVAFNKIYEPCVYAVRGKPFLNKKMTKLHEVLNREVETGNRAYDEIMEHFDLWLVPRDVDYMHPTQKPITLHEKPLRRCTAPGHIVLDLFGGSGSTLIACEQMRRVCYMMEKDQIFMQVIIDRYEQATGRKAVKL